VAIRGVEDRVIERGPDVVDRVSDRECELVGR
jgi:hypothetical protein